MIELRNLNVIFNKGTELAKRALENINFEISKGEFVTMIGGNGAGKSTVMNTLAGEIRSQSGKIFIDGKDVTNLSTLQRAPLISRVFQDPTIGTFAEMTIEENLNVAFGRNRFKNLERDDNLSMREKFKESLSELELGLENRLNDKISALSGGQRQAVSIVMATLQPSKVLLLDEHVAALDPKIGKTVMDITNKIIKKHSLTTLMITHSMDHALRYGNRTIMMYHGKIVRDMVGENRSALSPKDLVKFFDL